MRNLFFVPLLLTLLLAGCYETTFFIGRAEDAKVDPALLGQWSFDSLGENAKDQATLNVSSPDAHHYAMDWTAASDHKTIKMVGFVAEVKGARFIHATPLDAAGKPQEKHWIFRLDMDGNDKLVLSNLDTQFLDAHKVNSDDSLRATIETSLDDPALYEADVLTGTRVAK